MKKKRKFSYSIQKKEEIYDGGSKSKTNVEKHFSLSEENKINIYKYINDN